jgi:hypothetical protein
MKISTLIATAGLTLVSVSAFAHDPKEHQKEAAEAAHCAKMKDMDMSKMDPNDPVVKAMQKKCKAQMDHHASDHEHSDEHANTPEHSHNDESKAK